MNEPLWQGSCRPSAAADMKLRSPSCGSIKTQLLLQQGRVPFLHFSLHQAASALSHRQALAASMPVSLRAGGQRDG